MFKEIKKIIPSHFLLNVDQLQNKGEKTIKLEQ